MRRFWGKTADGSENRQVHDLVRLFGVPEDAPRLRPVH